MTKYFLFFYVITICVLHAQDESKGLSMNIAINGFGRIGRNFLRCVLEDPKARAILKVVAINLGPSSDLDTARHLFKYDTLLGMWPGVVQLDSNTLVIDGHAIQLLTEANPSACRWKAMDIDWVVESSGKFVDTKGASGHLTAGARHVLVSAPMKDDAVTVVPGVNLEQFKTTDAIVSLGSCTTNALMPILKVLLAECGLQSGYMTTIHAYTNDQVVLDVSHKDMRRARAAALNIIPTTTGAARMVTQFFPELKDKMPSTSIRVPVGKVSLVDVSFNSSKELSVEIINNALKEASMSSLYKIMSYSEEPLVSSDYYKNSASVTIDSLMTQVSGTSGRVFGWYDNEWGYSERLKDFLLYAQAR